MAERLSFYACCTGILRRMEAISPVIRALRWVTKWVDIGRVAGIWVSGWDWVTRKEAPTNDRSEPKYLRFPDDRRGWVMSRGNGWSRRSIDVFVTHAPTWLWLTDWQCQCYFSRMVLVLRSSAPPVVVPLCLSSAGGRLSGRRATPAEGLVIVW